MVPKSDFGKVFTIMYGLVGMTLMGLLVADGVLLFKKIYYTLYENIVNLSRRSELHHLQEQPSDDRGPKIDKSTASYQQQDPQMQQKSSAKSLSSEADEDNKSVGRKKDSSDEPKDLNDNLCKVSKSISIPVVGFCILYFFVIFLPGFILQRTVDWDLLSIHYFLFISFTTTGFGDFSLRDSDSTDVLQLGFFIYLLIGLCALGGLLSAIQAALSQTEKKMESRLEQINLH